MTDDAGNFNMSLKGEGDNRVITSSPVSFTVIETITGLGKTSEPTETILDRFSNASKKAEENAALAESYSKSASVSKAAAAQSESNAKTYSESAKSSETASAENATKTQSLLDEAKRLDRFHVNYLTKTTDSDTFVHVEDAFEGGRIRGFTIKGAYSQTTTTGANLWPQIESLKMDGVTFEPYANRDGHTDRGMVKVSGTPTLANRCASVEVSLEAGTYSFKNFGYYSGSSTTDKGAVYLRVRVGSDEYTAFGSEITSFTISEATTVNLDIMTGAIGTLSPGVVMPMLVKGSTFPLVWEEYTAGNPSPSPDYPQEVHVGEKCDVKVTGRNLLDPSTFIINEGSVGYKIFDDDGYCIENDQEHDGRGQYISNADFKFYPRCDGFVNTLEVESPTTNPSRQFCIITDYERCISNSTPNFSIGTDSKNLVAQKTNGLFYKSYEAKFRPSISFGEFKGYRKYECNSVSIPLPEEHPYLAALPDGTFDEIVVDSDGHAVMTARVLKIDNKEVSIQFDKNNSEAYAYGLDNSTGKLLSNNFSNVITTRNTLGIASGDGFVYFMYPGTINDADSAKAVWVDYVIPVYSKLATPVTYDLGYIDMPLQPDRYCNIWVDGGDDYALPEVSATYERDINIVVSELESRLASE